MKIVEFGGVYIIILLWGKVNSFAGKHVSLLMSTFFVLIYTKYLISVRSLGLFMLYNTIEYSELFLLTVRFCV